MLVPAGAQEDDFTFLEHPVTILPVANRVSSDPRAEYGFAPGGDGKATRRRTLRGLLLIFSGVSPRPDGADCNRSRIEYPYRINETRDEESRVPSNLRGKAPNSH